MQIIAHTTCRTYPGAWCLVIASLPVSYSRCSVTPWLGWEPNSPTVTVCKIMSTLPPEFRVSYQQFRSPVLMSNLSVLTTKIAPGCRPELQNQHSQVTRKLCVSGFVSTPYVLPRPATRYALSMEGPLWWYIDLLISIDWFPHLPPKYLGVVTSSTYTIQDNVGCQICSCWLFVYQPDLWDWPIHPQYLRHHHARNMAHEAHAWLIISSDGSLHGRTCVII